MQLIIHNLICIIHYGADVDDADGDGDVDADDADVETRASSVQSRHLRRTTRINLPSYNPRPAEAPQGTAAHISYLLDEQSRGFK